MQGALVSVFQAGLLKRQLCVALNDSRIQPIRWTWKVKDKVCVLC